MTTTNKTQLRGYCQCCGRDQAVMAKGTIAKHGYTVDNGWFNGVCTGQHYKPMEHERTKADSLIVETRERVAAMRKEAADLEAGRTWPETVRGKWDHDKREWTQIPYADAPDYLQFGAREKLAREITMHADQGDRFAKMLQRCADEYHGKALRVVEVAQGPAPIVQGDKRNWYGEVVSCNFVDRGRVTFSVIAKDPAAVVRQSSVTTRAWRLLPEVNA